MKHSAALPRMGRCLNCALPLLIAMNLPQDELHAWLVLATGGLSARRRSRRLLAHFGGALEVFMAGPTAAQAALDGEPLDGLFSAVPEWADTAQRTRHWLAASPPHHVIPCLLSPSDAADE